MAGLDLPHSSVDLLAAGSRALADGAWEESRAYFQAAVAEQETPEALEGLGTAAWWLDDAPVVFGSRADAYRLYRRRGDCPGAARMAIWLALDHYLYRGELAVAGGWLQRAHRLLHGIEPSFEHGWLALIEAHIALFEHNDVAAAKAASSATVVLAQSLSLTDLEMLALALEGLVLVSEGRIGEGMRRLDEATTAALSGEMTDPDAIVTACCYLIYACERVRDFDRAAQWCSKVAELCRRWSYRSILAICRVHYAAVLIWQGKWPQADAELTTAMRDLTATRPGWAPEGVLRLAELRRRQGRLDEAIGLFDQVPFHPLALLGQAELALSRGEMVLAADIVDRFFRRVPREDRTERARGLELAVRVQVALGAIDRAREFLGELDAVADLVGTEPLRGAACFASGIVAAAAGDIDAARPYFEDAVDHFRHSGAPFEAGLARLELVPVLATLNRGAAAVTEARVALDTFRQLGATREAGRASELLHDLDLTPSGVGDDVEASTGLTRREAEVLRLVASGQSNHQIAEQLFISVRTVERHISTIYEKIGVEGKAARVIATSFAIEHGLTTPLRS